MKVKQYTLWDYTLEIYQYIDDFWFERNWCKFIETLNNWDRIYHHIVLPVMVENYNKDFELASAPDLDRYNMREILEEAINDLLGKKA